MTKLRIYNLTDNDLPDTLELVKEVFINGEKNSRRSNESLHDYFSRRGFKCFCKKCAKQRNLDKNSTLAL